MPDIVDAETRSRMMAGIKGKNTRPEMLIRKGLHARGFRFRLHAKNLPGRPDLVLPRYRAAIFVHGCFWHRHDCHLFRLPSTRTEFWAGKLNANRMRDERTRGLLTEAEWRVLVIWECAIKGRSRLDPALLLEQTANWILGKHDMQFIEGAKD